MIMRVGDLEPALRLELTRQNVAVDLTTATSVYVIGTLNGATVFNRVATTATSLGVVTMNWQSGDTATAGQIVLRVKVTWPSARPETIPTDKVVRVEA